MQPPQFLKEGDVVRVEVEGLGAIENKVVAHIAVLLTLLVVVGLIKPLTGAMGREDSAAVGRVAVMLALGVYAMATFVKSFIDARKARG